MTAFHWSRHKPKPHVMLHAWPNNYADLSLMDKVRLHIDVFGGNHMATPTGNVTVVDTISNNTLASGTLDGTGSATLTWTAVAGSYNLVANYAGDSNFSPSSSAPVPYVVTAAQGTTTTMTVTPASPAAPGTGVSFDVTVAAAIAASVARSK